MVTWSHDVTGHGFCWIKTNRCLVMSQVSEPETSSQKVTRILMVCSTPVIKLEGTWGLIKSISAQDMHGMEGVCTYVGRHLGSRYRTV